MREVLLSTVDLVCNGSSLLLVEACSIIGLSRVLRCIVVYESSCRFLVIMGLQDISMNRVNDRTIRVLRRLDHALLFIFNHYVINVIYMLLLLIVALNDLLLDKSLIVAANS